MLALRVLMIALIALAFDQPSWEAAVDWERAAPPGRDVVIVLDQSASMQRVEAGRTLFDRAKVRAFEAIDELNPAHDRAAVVFVRLQPQAALPELSTNYAALRERIRGAEVTHERGDAAGAMALASALLANGATAIGARNVVIVTDRQESQWSAIADSMTPDGAGILIESVGSGEELANTAVVDFVWPERALSAGERARIGVRLRHFGNQARHVTVTLDISGELLRERAQLTSWSTTTVWFDALVPEDATDEIAVSVFVDSDEFPVDDALKARVAVSPVVRAALIGRVQTSLASAAVRGAIEATGAQVELVMPESGFDLSRFELLIMLGDAGVEYVQEHESAIRSYVERGGGLAMFVDSPAAAAAVAVLEWSGVWRSGVLSIDADASLSADEFTTWIGENEQVAAVLAPLLERIRFTAIDGLLTDASDRNSVLFASGSVFVSSVEVGFGHAAVVNADVSAVNSSFVASPVFPLMIDALVDRLVPHDEWPVRMQVGERLANVDQIVEAPAGFIERRADGWFAAAPGAATWKSEGSARRDVVVGVDPAESDLRLMELGGIQGQSEGAGPGREAAGGTALWPWLIGGALIAAVIEMLCGAALRRGRSGEGAFAWAK